MALFAARPRRQVLVPLLGSAVFSGVAFAAGVHDASSFHTVAAACVLLALAYSALLLILQPQRSRLATVAWSLLGVVLPPGLLFLFLLGVCWNGCELG